MRILTAILLYLIALPALAIPVFPVEVVARYPHNRDAFTQGITWHDGVLYESTGLYGRSSLRKVELRTGRVIASVAMDRREFGEDITVIDGVLWQLTWQNGRAYRYDPETLERQGRAPLRGEGWGLTHWGGKLVKSDGTDELMFLDARTLRETHRVRVTADGRPVRRLNALQAIGDRVYANVWQTTRIAEIDPADGSVTAWLELSPLLEHLDFDPDLAVESPNGIAFDADGRRLFVTGKLWPWLFEVKVRRDGQRWP